MTSRDIGAAVFPATTETAKFLEELTGEDAPGLRAVLSAKNDIASIDVYACWATGKLIDALSEGVGVGRLLLRSPTGYDTSLFDAIKDDSSAPDRVKVIERTEATHAKIYILHLESDMDMVIVGSSNATAQGFGLKGGVEQNMAIVLPRTRMRNDDPRAVFDGLWNDPLAEPFDPNKHRPAPLLKESSSPLWPFQKEALGDIRSALNASLWEGLKRKGKAVPGAIAALPTGAGKTVVAVRWLLTDVLVQEPGQVQRRALWIVHTKDLQDQALARYREDAGELAPVATVLNTGMNDGEFAEALRRGQMVFSTRQLLASRVDAIEESFFDAIVVDEAHHVGSWTRDYPRILKKLDHAVRLGITATPHRTGEGETEGLYSYFDPKQGNRLGPVHWRTFGGNPEAKGLKDEVVEGKRLFAIPRYSALDLSKKGVPQIDIRGIHNDHVLKGIDGFDGEERVARIAEAFDPVQHRPALFFAVDIEDANAITAALNARGHKVQALHSEPSVLGCLNPDSGPLSYQARSRIVGKLRDAEQTDLDAIVSVDLFIEGLDIPLLKSVFLARPTFSRRVYLQMLGRGLRGPAAGGTETCEVIGILDNFRRHETDKPLQTYETAVQEESKGVERATSTEEEGVLPSRRLLPAPGPITPKTLAAFCRALNKEHAALQTISKFTGFSEAAIRKAMKKDELPKELKEVLAQNGHRDRVDIRPAWDPPPVRLKTPTNERGLGRLLDGLERAHVDKEAFAEAVGTDWKTLRKTARSEGSLDQGLEERLRQVLRKLRAERS